MITRTQGQFAIPMLKHYMANQCTKLEVSRFSHSGDILGGTITTPLLGWFFIYLVRFLLDKAYSCTKFDSSSLSHSSDMDGGSNI